MVKHAFSCRMHWRVYSARIGPLHGHLRPKISAMLLQIEGNLYLGYLNSGNFHYSGCTSFFMCTQLHSCLTFVLRVISDFGFTHPWMSLKINQLCLVRQPLLSKLFVLGPNKLLFLQDIQRKSKFVLVMFYQKQSFFLHTFW